MSEPAIGARLGRPNFNLNLNTLAFATLPLALLAHIWFASTPLPFGGPNIALAFVAVLLAIVAFLAKPTSDGIATSRQRLAPILPVVAVAALLTLCALTVYLATGTLHPTRLAKMALGIGVLAATFVLVSNVPRARMLVLVFVGGTVASALFGMAVVWIGDPFVGVWLQISNISEEDLQDMLLFGRNAGLAAHISTFGRQLAVAIPFALAALLYSNYGNQLGRRRCIAAGVFVLLMTLVTAMLMNSTRSVLLGVCVVCAIVVLPALRSVRPRRRFLISAPLAALWLWLFLFNPFVGDAEDDAVTTHVGGVLGDIQGLAVGDAALYAGNADTVGHAFAGNMAGEDYELQLRERYMTGYGQPGVVNARADDHGAIVVTWRKWPDVVLYQYRLRRAGAGKWPMWRNFIPSLEANGVRTRYEPVTLEGVVMGADWPDGPADRQRLRHRVYGLKPNARYTVELVPMTVDERGVLSEWHTTADEEGVIVVTWLAPRELGVIGYSRRTRIQGGLWQPWTKFETPARVIAPEITLPDLTVGGQSLASEAPNPRIGHTFSGFVPWFWYVVQVRQWQASGLTKRGEVTAKPDEGGNFTLAWQAPKESSEGTGYQFRARKLGDAEWLPWQDFAPSLSSRVPSLKPVASFDKDACTSAQRGSERTRCHTLEGLSAGLDYRAQLRASNAHGFGAESDEFTFSPDRAGTWTFAWREPAGEAATGYQFRLWWRAKDRWWPWQTFVPAGDGQGRTTADLLGRLDAQKRNVAAARVARRVGSGAVESKRGISQRMMLDDWSAQTRLHGLATVFRYVREHPFGTGVYAPNRSHVGEGIEEWLLEELLRLWPHNQFLHVWVLFGHLGLALLVAFYACVLRPAIRCSVVAWRIADTDLRFLAAGVVGAWAAYTINSMFVPTGPFLGGWSHFYLIGLLFGVERLVRDATAGVPATGGAANP